MSIFICGLNKIRLISLSETNNLANSHLPYDKCAPVAQLDRVPGYELGGREFESLRAHQILPVYS
jgi:hypothetical protein